MMLKMSNIFILLHIMGGCLMEGQPGSRQRLKLKCGFLVLCIYLLGGLLISGAAFASEESELFLARGNKLYLEGKYTQAKDELAKADELDPNNPEIMSLLGTTDLALKDYQGAKEAFTKTVALAPDYPRAQTLSGGGQLLPGKLSRSRALDQRGQGPGPGRWLGRLLSGPGKCVSGASPKMP